MNLIKIILYTNIVLLDLEICEWLSWVKYFLQNFLYATEMK